VLHHDPHRTTAATAKIWFSVRKKQMFVDNGIQSSFVGAFVATRWRHFGRCWTALNPTYLRMWIGPFLLVISPEAFEWSELRS
jgi:hypothetical protein